MNKVDKKKKQYPCQKSVGGVKSGGVSLSVYFGSLNGRGSKGSLRVGIWLPVDVYQWVLHRGGGGPAAARLLIEVGLVRWNKDRNDGLGGWEKTGDKEWSKAKVAVVQWATKMMGKKPKRQL